MPFSYSYRTPRNNKPFLSRASMTPRSTKKTVAQKNNTNYAVKKVYNKRTEWKPSATRNKSAIAVLSKQVRQLQMKDYGMKQYHRLILCTDAGVRNISGAGIFTKDKPFAWEMPNFYHGAQIFTGAETAGVPIYQSAYRWLVLGEDGNSGYQSPYQFGNPNDKPSLEQYLPLSSFYKFHFKVLNASVGQDTRFRLQIIQVKQAGENTKIDVALPNHLGAYKNLIREDPADENKLSPFYHKVLYDKTINVRNSGDVVKSIEKYYNLKWTFPAKPVRLDPEQISSTEGSTVTTQALAGQAFVNYGKPQEKIWCILSTSAASAIEMEVSVMRTDVWRDQHGVITR